MIVSFDAECFWYRKRGRTIERNEFKYCKLVSNPFQVDHWYVYNIYTVMYYSTWHQNRQSSNWFIHVYYYQYYFIRLFVHLFVRSFAKLYYFIPILCLYSVCTIIKRSKTFMQWSGNDYYEIIETFIYWINGQVMMSKLNETNANTYKFNIKWRWRWYEA